MPPLSEKAGEERAKRVNRRRRSRNRRRRGTVFGRGLGGKAFAPQQRKARRRRKAAERRIPKAPRPAPGLPPRKRPKAFRPFAPGRERPAEKVERDVKKARTKARKKLVLANLLAGGSKPKFRRRSYGVELENAGQLAKELGVDRADVAEVISEGSDDRALARSRPLQKRLVAQRRKHENVFGRQVASAREESTLEKAGLGGVTDAISGALAKANPLAAVGLNLAVATGEEPGKVLKTSTRTAKESIAGIPQGVKMLVDDPPKAFKAIAEDYEKRYGPLLEGDAKTFRDQVKSEYGLTPYTLDALAGVAGVGQASGAVARTGAAGRLAARLEQSREPLSRTIGRGVAAAHKTATMERPRLRISAGETGSRPQRTSKNLFVAAGQRRRDTRRGRKFEQEAEGAGFRVEPGGRLSPIEGREQRNLRAVRPGEGEVLPYGSVRDSALLHRLVGRTERVHGARKAAERLRLLTQSANVEREARRALKGLDSSEQEGLLYAMQFGLPGDNPAAAVKLLKRYRDQVSEHRRGEGEVLPFEPDELPVINRIIEEPETYLTPRVRQVASELRELERRESAKDPDLARDRAADRRVLPLSMTLGLEARRAPDREEFLGRLDAIEARLRDRGIDPGDLRRRFGGIADLEPPDRLPVMRDLERALRAEKGKAERTLATAERHAAAARAVRRDRENVGRPLETGEVRAARGKLAKAKRERRRAGKGVTRQEYRTGVSHGRTQLAGERSTRKAVERLERAQEQASRALERGDVGRAEAKIAEIREIERQIDVGATERQAAGAERAGGDALARRITFSAAERRVREARAELEQALEGAPRASEAIRARERTREEAVIRKRAERDDARIEHAVAAHLKGELKARPGRYEDSASFNRRVLEVAEREGLEAPAYFESSGGAELRRSLKAIGTGVRGAAGSKSYSGKRLLAGRQSGDPEVIVNGLLRNVKRRFSWRYTITTVNQAAFEWSRGAHRGGLTAAEIQRELRRRHIDPDEVEFVNVRVLENRELDAEGLARGEIADPVADASPTGGIHPDDLAEVGRGLDEARVSQETVLAEATDVGPGQIRGQAMNRYVALPVRDFKELSASITPDGVIGRGIDIVWKQKPARILLGLANTSWLAFQVMANGFLAGLGGALNPFDYVASQRWWKGLSPEEKLAIEPELGITHHHHHIGDETHLGAATNNRFVNAWRAFKQTKVMRTAHKGNPLDLMFRLDEAQNNFFRRTVFYNQAKRDAYKRMGASWTSVAGTQKKLMSVLSLKRPEDRLTAIVNEADTFAKHAEHVKEWLGDYLTYSSLERRTLGRSVMFYGYLRFSLRFVFWTMPAKHPITAAILTDLGRLGADEVKRLLGAEPEENVPTTMLAQVYWGSPSEIKDQAPGSGSINFGRMNPFLNAVTQLEDAEQIAGLISPVAQAEVDQIFKHSSFLQRDWRIKGKSTPAESQRPKDYFGGFWSQLDPTSSRGRILQRQLLSLAQPYRVLEETGIPPLGLDPLAGSHSDDSLPWSPRPLRYVDEKARRGTERSRRRELEQGPLRPLLRRLLPPTGLIDEIGPSPTAAPIVIEREREKREAIGKGRKKRRRGGGGASGLGGGGGGGGGSGSASGL